MSSDMASPESTSTQSDLTEDDCQALPPSKRRRKTTKCAVASCPSPEDASYHNFPKDPNLLVKWIKACQKDKYFNPKTSRLCSTHFKDSCYERDLRNELLGLKPRRLLKTGSVPTINLNEGSSGDEGTEGSLLKEFRETVSYILTDEPIREDVPEEKSITRTGADGRALLEKQEIQSLKETVASLEKELAISQKETSDLEEEVEYLNSKEYKMFLIQSLLEKTVTPALADKILYPDDNCFIYSPEDMKRALASKNINGKTFDTLRRTQIIKMPKDIETWPEDP